MEKEFACKDVCFDLEHWLKWFEESRERLVILSKEGIDISFLERIYYRNRFTAVAEVKRMYDRSCDDSRVRHLLYAVKKSLSWQDERRMFEKQKAMSVFSGTQEQSRVISLKIYQKLSVIRSKERYFEAFPLALEEESFCQHQKDVMSMGKNLFSYEGAAAHIVRSCPEMLACIIMYIFEIKNYKYKMALQKMPTEKLCAIINARRIQRADA